MNKRMMMSLGMVLASIAGASCSKTSTDGTTTTTTSATCTSPEPYATATGTTNSLGCALMTRDTTSCQASRTAQGLSGYWLKFSCRVTLTKSGSTVSMVANGVPDHKSYYFGSSSSCYETFNTTGGRTANPGSISSLSITMEAPANPVEKTSSKTATSLGGVGLALNGVLIFNNGAGPGDNIYDEVKTFDSCEGHPAMTHYHYHIEPPTLTSSDNKLIGVMRDGFPVYGRYDSGTTPLSPALDSNGGHTGPLPDEPGTTLYHYHLVSKTGNNTAGTPTTAFFIKADSYHGTPGTTCTNCMP